MDAVTIRIAPGLELPDDVVTQAIAILARRGAGKTHTASVLVEEVVKAKLPVVVIDPTGAWWGLRSSADGEKPGLPVVILGGEHGDVPLERTAGSVVADVVVEHPGAYVIDLSGLPSRSAEQTFVADFLERLYRAKANRREALLVVVDEADVFAPQRPGPEQARSLGAMEGIVRRGRIRGLGCLLISQRAAVLNKNVLTQTEALIAMQTTGPQDRDAIDEWVKGNGTPDERAEVLGSLASLERGEAWVWSPAWLRTLQRVRIRRRTTFDSSRTPEAGESAAAPLAFAKVDLEQLGSRIAATVERAKADDPKALRARIAELERELASKPAATVERVEVPVLNEEQLTRLEDAVSRLTTVAMEAAGIGKDIGAIASEVVGALGDVRAPRVEPEPAPAPRPERVAAPRPVPIERPSSFGPEQMGRADRALLAALVAWHPAGLTKVQLSLVTEYSRTSSSFSNALGRLRSLGYVERTGEPIRATDAGVAAAGPVERPPAPGPELVAWWRGRLGRAEQAFFEALTGIWPDAGERQQLAELTGYSPTSSSYSNALGRLRSLGLVDGWRASDWVMGA